MATEICNDINKNRNNDKVTVCRNTLIDTLKAYTDVDICATLRRKTGKKDITSAWAVARKAFAEQMLEQIRLGEEIDAGRLTLQECSDLIPIYFDGSRRSVH